jgi:hypothetical protein
LAEGAQPEGTTHDQNSPVSYYSRAGGVTGSDRRRLAEQVAFRAVALETAGRSWRG